MTQATRVRRWLVPATAAVVVLALIGGVWAALSHGDGTRPAGFAGGGVAGGAGSVPRSDPGSDPGRDPGPAPGGPRLAHAVRIDSYYAYDPRHLAINYTTGVPSCYGHVRAPRIQQGPTAVTVTLLRTLPHIPKGTACIDLAMVTSVRITLAAPLGHRVVRDGATGSVVRPGTAPNDPAQSK